MRNESNVLIDGQDESWDLYSMARRGITASIAEDFIGRLPTWRLTTTFRMYMYTRMNRLTRGAYGLRMPARQEETPK